MKKRNLLTKMVALCMVAAMISATMLTAAAAGNDSYNVGKDTAPVFVDVPTDAYYAAELDWAVEAGITTGTGDGTTFSPTEPCTLSQMMAFIWRAAGQPAPKGTTTDFADVDLDAYYGDAVLWAQEMGIIVDGDSTFGVNDVCTRAQMVMFLWRAAGSPSVTGDQVFTDIPADADYAAAALWAMQQGITKGVSTTSYVFDPDAGCDRGQMVTFLYRTYAD